MTIAIDLPQTIKWHKGGWSNMAFQERGLKLLIGMEVRLGWHPWYEVCGLCETTPEQTGGWRLHYLWERSYFLIALQVPIVKTVNYLIRRVTAGWDNSAFTIPSCHHHHTGPKKGRTELFNDGKVADFASMCIFIFISWYLVNNSLHSFFRLCPQISLSLLAVAAHICSWTNLVCTENIGDWIFHNFITFIHWHFIM